MLNSRLYMEYILMSASGIRMYKLWSVYIYVHSLGKWCDDIYIVIFTFKTMVDFSLHILILYTETPMNTPPQVENVTVTRGVSDGSPSLTVSWSAVPGSGITYTVWYSTQNCTIKNLHLEQQIRKESLVHQLR